MVCGSIWLSGSIRKGRTRLVAARMWGGWRISILECWRILEVGMILERVRMLEKRRIVERGRIVECGRILERERIVGGWRVKK